MGKLVQGEWIGTNGDTQHTPTDTEMLDWMFSTRANLNAFHGSFWISYHQDKVSESKRTPRAAIAAAMEKEAQ
jgi:hypothetical protein